LRADIGMFSGSHGSAGASRSQPLVSENAVVRRSSCAESEERSGHRRQQPKRRRWEPIPWAWWNPFNS